MDKETSPLNEYALKIGKIVVNRQSLELCLRLFLSYFNNEPSFSIDAYKKGDDVPLNSLTNYDTLGTLIEKYNNVVNVKIDKSVVDVRDMIAHGRIMSDHPKGPFSLYKYSKPKGNNKVEVTQAVVIGDTWLNDKINLIKNQVDKIINEARLRGYDIFPD